MLVYVRRNAVACLALLVALGGTSYGAVGLPSNSVGTRQLQNGAVTKQKLGFDLSPRAGSLPDAFVNGLNCSILCPPLTLVPVGSTKLTLRHEANVVVLAAGTFYPSQPGMKGLLGASADAARQIPDRATMTALVGGGETVNYQGVVQLEPGRHRVYVDAGAYGPGTAHIYDLRLAVIAVPK
jgi:hypothetical protein